MIKFLSTITVILLVVTSCTSQATIDKEVENIESGNAFTILNPEGTTLSSRFNPPVGFERTEEIENSFQSYLRNLPLKPNGSNVLYYDGRVKSNQVFAAVVDLEIGKRDLHQCADAVMRLRAEYLWNTKQYDKIHFNFTNGFRVDYSKWMQGQRVGIDGNRTFWKSGGSPSNTYASFWKYMELIFTYAGTLSLDKELKTNALDKMKIGDVFIKGGSPGHAVIVVDMATNNSTGEKLFMLAQSYMPAQELQILYNFNNKDISPWYRIPNSNELNTPEWTFTINQLKSF
jgi:prepilin-type processing-associated H-X9-DG protein